MDYRYHIDYWKYTNDKSAINSVYPVLAKYCPNTMTHWERTAVHMDAALKFYEMMQDRLDYRGYTGDGAAQGKLYDIANDTVGKFYDALTDEYAKMGIQNAFYDELITHENIRVHRGGEDFARQYMNRRPDLFPPSMRDMVNIYAVEEHAITERNHGCAPDNPRVIDYDGLIIERADGMPLL